jgi:hypothetical protein
MNEYRDVLVVIWTWIHVYGQDRARKRNLLTYWLPVPTTCTLVDIRELADIEINKFRAANNSIVHSSVYCYIDTRTCSDK